ncbi:cell division protein FtsP [Erwinia sp. OLTSP20]|uniref:cell division protein FtsP n=1 Tax=unclassified Erwinia TaxID=2622719 RepID=UPI000C17D2A0|nr:MULTISPECIES: cell division protein FtsP [unclassified Erwinia]PIJ49865.1 cell division protein FtsP [Erwinia sp. OAMSP11]PIJ70963.1 cell division protein FtsP [Erwinia sp. OLSSP12]PIJ80329.1 cell division protein FtsP [Erwinia sp. OLCASP19]PIJ82453.1 cell division protein FtsP [Erwinia sp. OLMTSP26]PIJ85138.1 cell division protein FtsP [Erwinia sp. OLMDSP33]
MSLSRRQFIQASGTALCASLLPVSARASAGGNPLPVPPLIESRRGQPIFLTLQRSHWSFSGSHGNKTLVWGINGQYLGPTVRVWSGDDVKLVWSNRLPEPVAMSVSGLQVPGALAGGAPRQMSTGADWAPVIPVSQPAATCWYHATTPNRMAPHVYNGLAGMWLVEDEMSRALQLPNHYGVDDFPLIIQDKRLDSFGAALYNPPSDGGFAGDTLLVNGIQNPYVEVSRGWVRLRLLNASNARRFELTMSDNRPFTVITSDQGYLPAPLNIQQLPLAPGERRDILVDMSQGNEVSITAGEAPGLMERLRGFFQPSTSLMNTLVLTLRPTGLLPLVTSNLPMRLLADQLLEGAISRTREFRLGDRQPGINGALWDMRRTDVQTQQGVFERWIIHADLPQSFHIQGVRFLVKSVNGAPALAEDSGWKDTVWVDGDVELLVAFDQPSSEHLPFLYYSQTLEMADRGSAGQLLVIPTP